MLKLMNRDPFDFEQKLRPEDWYNLYFSWGWSQLGHIVNDQAYGVFSACAEYVCVHLPGNLEEEKDIWI